MKQRKQLLKPLGLISPQLSQHLLRLLLLLVTAIGGVGSSWADSFEWSHDGQKSSLTVTTDETQSYSSYTISYGGTTYTSAIKMQSTTTLSFTTTKTSTVTVGVALRSGNTYSDASKTALSLTTGTSSPVTANTGITESTSGATTENGLEVVFNNVPAGTQVIKRAGSEEGVFYIKVVEEDAAPVSSACDILSAKYNGVDGVKNDKTFKFTIPYDDHGNSTDINSSDYNTYSITLTASDKVTIYSKSDKTGLVNKQSNGTYVIKKSLDAAAGKTNGQNLYVYAEDGTLKTWRVELVRDIPTASDAAPYSMTSLIKDASFDGAAVDGNKLGGWTWTKRAYNGPQYPYNATAENTTAAEFWDGENGPKLDFSLYQTLTALPAGTYKLSAKAGNAQNTEGSKGGFAVLFANVGSEAPTGSPETTAFGCPSAKVKVVADAKENAETYEVYFKLDNTSDVTIGFKTFGTPDGRWFYCDDFTLEYYGIESTHTASADATVLKEVEDFRSGGRQHTNFYVGQEIPHNLVLKFKEGESISWGEGNFTLESSNPEVATVAWRNNNPSIQFNALAAGSTTITVTFHAEGFKNKVVEIPLTVAAPCKVTFATEDETKGTVSATGPRNVTNFDNNTGVLTSDNKIPAGTVVKFTAAPAEGYEFNGWYSGDDLVSSDAEYTTTVNADVNLKAKFKTASLPSVNWIFDEESKQGTYTDEGLDLVITGNASWNTEHSLAGLKLNGDATTITFTPNANGVLTVKGTVFKNNSPLLVVTQNGNALSCNEEEKTGTEISYNVTAGQTVTIVRQKDTGSSLRITEIEFTPTGAIMLTAPQISVEGNVVTFANPNEGSTLYYKVDRTKEGDVSTSDQNTTEATHQVTLPYGVYPANWIQAYVVKGDQSSEITKYAEEVTVAPEAPTFTKTATAINFTAPEGCTLEFHVGSADAEAISVNSATTTVTVSGQKMTINGTEYDKATLYVKSVAEYATENSGTATVASEAVEVTTDVTNVASVSIPETLEIHVGQTLSVKLEADWIDNSNIPTMGSLTKRWVITSGSGNISLARNINTISEITGVKSNTSDDATAKVKVTVDGVESNECTITIKRAPLAVRADHIALSHNGNASRELKAVTYNPYNRKVVSSNIELTAAIKEGTSKFATSTGNTITPTGTAIGKETWTVTATPKSGKAEENLYTAGTADIQVTCRDYIYAYGTGVPATAPTARPVTNADNDIALNYYAGHNPAGCKPGADKEPYATWGTKKRGPQEQVIANYSKTITHDSEGNEVVNIQRPFARIHGWDGIKNVAEPTMNSMSEQHSTNPEGKYVYDGRSNGKFTYKSYNYYGDHDEFNVPVMGSFYRFYPEKNGTLIAYLCVNGQFSDTDMENLAKNNDAKTGYASRSTYFLDPYANSMQIQNATVQPTSTIQTGFFYYTLENCTSPAKFTSDVEYLLNNWAAWGNDEKDASGNLVIPVKSESYAAKKADYTINDVDWGKFKALAQDPVGIFQQPIPNGDGSFRVITKTYVRCEVPVQKGRVYYVSPTGTKTRMAGVEFIVENDNDPVANVKLYSGKMDGEKTDTNPYIVPAGQNNFFKNVDNNGKYFNVTLQDRSFNAGEWYSFCMPFDVPEKQIHDIFGADAITIHFDNVSEKTENGETVLQMNFWSHFYDQIRAGRPIMIKMPAQFPDGTTKLAEGSVTFKHVRLNLDEDAQPEKLYMSDANGWTFKGTYDPVRMGKNAVIINGTNFYHYRDTEKTLAGNRAWIQGPANSNARVVTYISSFDDNADEATGIEAVLSEMGFKVMKTTDKIYNLNGQMVGQGADINNLPKGVYIVNGKKQIVK